MGTVLGQVVAALMGLAILVRHYGGIASLLSRIAPGEMGDTVAIGRMFGLSRDLMIRSMALMGAYAWFAAQGSRMVSFSHPPSASRFNSRQPRSNS